MRDIFLLVIGAALGFMSQWLLEIAKDRRAKRRGPNIAIGKYEEAGAVYAELHNLGPDGLAEMDVAIAWEENGATAARILKNFFEPTQKLGIDQPGFSDYLAAGERLLASEIPIASDDGLVTVRVTGLGQNSRRLYETRGQLDVRVRPTT